MKQLLVFLLMFTGSVAYAQQYSLEGSVAEQGGEALPYASVFLLHPKDSATVAATTTSAQGLFMLKGIKKGDYILRITFVGYAPYSKKISTPAQGRRLRLGKIELKPQESELEAITILGEKEAVLVKQDTIEYNTSSYNTRANANVEQLLKRLPGLEVQRDGTIRVQGETVTRIFVDGKEFFGGNVQMATKNLPADAIESVQLIDGKSEEARFSGIDDGKREKVINLTLKEDRKNMGFGKATAGAGTNNRYMGQANYNRFSEDRQLTLMGMSNNINILDLAGGDAPGEEGSAAATADQPGLQTTHSGGVHLFEQLNTKTSLIASYQLNHSRSSLQENLLRQNFLPEGTALYTENSLQQNKSGGHQFHATLDHKENKNTFRLNTSVNVADFLTTSRTGRQSFAPDDSLLVNEGERNMRLDNKNVSLLALMFWGHRFDKAGRVFTLNSQFSTNHTYADGRSEAFTRFLQGPDEVVDQQNDQRNKNLNYSLRLAYTEPLGNKQFLQTNYDISNRRARSEVTVWDIMNESRELNEEQSNHFENGFLRQTAGLTYRLTPKGYTIAVGAGLQHASLSRRLYPSGEQEGQNFLNILPSAMLSRTFNRHNRLNLQYRTFVREPSINQLQPVVSRFDPLHQFIGNPGLRPEYRHQARLSFNSSDLMEGVFLSSSLTLNYTNNPILASVQVDENQRRTTQYVNLGHNRDAAFFVNLGVPLKKYNSQLNFSPFLQQGKSMNLLNGQEGDIRQRSLGSRLDWAYRYQELLEVNLGASLSTTRSRYAQENRQDQFFMNTAYNAEAALQLLKGLWFTSDFFFSRFRNPQANFEQAVPILNFSLSKLLLSDNRGELKLSAVNVLNRNLAVKQFASLNYMEQSVQNALGNYYMLSFTYRLNRQPGE